MNLRDMFSRCRTPDTRGLQEGDEKNKRTMEIILPPTDEKGRFVPDRSRPGMTIPEYLKTFDMEGP
ncbi:MAG: hypothetical protein FWH47_00185 [Methanomassiliicoccaceae archaeon]|nr:hypothetical protein [Methanomassiliicoccaceae archaeon]